MDDGLTSLGRGDLLPGTLSLGYSPPPDTFDEMASGSGALRAHWQRVADFIVDMSPEDWARRWDEGLRTIREHGVTYNVYLERPFAGTRWRLDPVPLAIGAEEWTELRAALVQRATLLDLVLRDLLGHQTLLADGHLPPALVYGHPGYFRPCVDAAVGDRQCLQLYAADLARAPDGRWRVMMDRTEAPSGFGYALENRQILGRVFPELIRGAGVRPIGEFFRDMRLALQAAAPRRSADARIVLLTPGRGNEAHFEHAFLARHLGCTLVEADDLTVRAGHVYLKTLQGLKPVDVILRRTDTAYCDPLELRPDSALGVPGLLHAARLGNVAVVNALGSGVIESPGLMPFLPGLSQLLLGEELKLPSVATWWCGQERERNHVLDHLDALVVKPAFPADAGEPVFGHVASAKERHDLAERIRQRPDRYIGQEFVSLSTAPTWSVHGLEPRAVTLRLMLCWTPDGWSVLPGGMVRVAPTLRERVVSMQRGGGAKDVWVLGGAPRGARSPAAGSGRRRGGPLLRRAAGNLPSRAADNLYWFGRYHERAEGVARRLRGAMNSIDERLLPVATREETEVLRGLLASGIFGPTPSGKDNAALLLRRAGQMVFDGKHSAGLLTSLNRLQRNAESVRERLSSDTWLAVTRVEEAMEAAQRVAQRPGLLLPRIDEIIYSLQALSGTLNETMSRSLPWRFYDTGRRLERALQMLDLFAATILRRGGDSTLVLDTLLGICDCNVTYRGRYVAEPELVPVLDLLVADLENPRSLGHQLLMLNQHIESLAELQGPFLGEDQRLSIAALAAVRSTDVEQMAAERGPGMRPLFEKMIEYLQSHLWDINNAVTRRYFSHATGRGRQLSIGVPALEEVSL